MRGDEATKREFTFELPKGFVDPEGNLHREVVIREINGADQEAMLNPQFTKNPAKMLSALLARVIMRLGTLDKGHIDTNVTAGMLKSDRDFLIVKLKELDSGPDLDMDVECPECGKKFKAALDLADFFVK